MQLDRLPFYNLDKNMLNSEPMKVCTKALKQSYYLRLSGRMKAGRVELEEFYCHKVL